jgi:23S rRNA pseudouridine1911/1915/1917 synthase
VSVPAISGEVPVPGFLVFEVEPASAGTRLDLFLAASLGTPRADARRLLARGRVRVDGARAGEAAKGLRLAAGARVTVEGWTPPGARRAAAEADRPLVVLAEGPGWIALDKPPGTPVHPFAEDERGSLLGALLARHPEVAGVGEGGLRSGVVHRLDVDTSGAVLFATEEETWRLLREAFRAGKVEKRYRAVVLGRMMGQGRLELDLLVARHRPARVRPPATPAEARRSRRVVLVWRVLEALRGTTLVEVMPETGFLHQIRAGLAHLGHPVAGDRLYGPPAAEDPSGATRHLLHAGGVAWESVRAESPDAPDFAGALARLRAPGGPESR